MDNLDRICKNCGYRLGKHYNISNFCPSPIEPVTHFEEGEYKNTRLLHNAAQDLLDALLVVPPDKLRIAADYANYISTITMQNGSEKLSKDLRLMADKAEAAIKKAKGE